MTKSEWTRFNDVVDNFDLADSDEYGDTQTINRKKVEAHLKSVKEEQEIIESYLKFLDNLQIKKGTVVSLKTGEELLVNSVVLGTDSKGLKVVGYKLVDSDGEVYSAKPDQIMKSTVGTKVLYGKHPEN